LVVAGTPSVSHSDVLKSYLGLLCMGKSDFEAIDGMRRSDWYKSALGIRKVPSKETLRQRFDKNADLLAPIIHTGAIEMLKAVKAPVTAGFMGQVPLDIDVFPMDNSDTKKEGVSRTYKGFDGYAPIAAYLGEEGWCIGLELREGRQNSQKGFVPFLDRVIQRARQLTDRTLLVRLDAAHCALETLAALRRHKNIAFVIKWNLRKEDPLAWRDRLFAEGRVTRPRPGKKVAVMTVYETREVDGKKMRFMRAMRVTERTTDRDGQMRLTPDITLEGWWTNRVLPEEQVIRLYEEHATSEQFHSEIKTDLDMERLPSGNFATNALVLTCAGMVYNMLRIIGQFGLLGDRSPVRHPAKRRRIRTVLQELMTVAGRFIRTGRRLILRLGRHCPAYEAFTEVHMRLSYG